MAMCSSFGPPQPHEACQQQKTPGMDGNDENDRDGNDDSDGDAQV